MYCVRTVSFCFFFRAELLEIRETSIPDNLDPKLPNSTKINDFARYSSQIGFRMAIVSKFQKLHHPIFLIDTNYPVNLVKFYSHSPGRHPKYGLFLHFSSSIKRKRFILNMDTFLLFYCVYLWLFHPENFLKATVPVRLIVIFLLWNHDPLKHAERNLFVIYISSSV